jgi:hypothetical protein
MAAKRKQTPKVNKPDWQRQLDRIHTDKLKAILARDWAKLSELQREEDAVIDSKRYNG